VEATVQDYGERAGLPLDGVFSDCCFGRGQCCISDKTAHASAFDFGGLIDEFAFIIGEVNECFFSKARRGSPTRCCRFFLCHKQMVSPNFLPLCHSTGAVHKSQGTCKLPASWRGAPFASTYSFVS
jgi:hypothetical protein